MNAKYKRLELLTAASEMVVDQLLTKLFEVFECEGGLKGILTESSELELAWVKADTNEEFREAMIEYLHDHEMNAAIVHQLQTLGMHYALLKFGERELERSRTDRQTAEAN